MDFEAQGDDSDRIQLAPLVDIIFLLLVFLLSMFALARAERDLSVDLPEASSASHQSRGLRDLLVNVRADGQLVLNGEDVDVAGLEDVLREMALSFPADTVVIRADGETPHRRFVEVLDVCRRHGVKSVAVVTTPDEEVAP